jgi:hypothetical protein
MENMKIMEVKPPGNEQYNKKENSSHKNIIHPHSQALRNYAAM